MTAGPDGGEEPADSPPPSTLRTVFPSAPGIDCCSSGSDTESKLLSPRPSRERGFSTFDTCGTPSPLPAHTVVLCHVAQSPQSFYGNLVRLQSLSRSYRPI